jgi:hypothetical protein
MGAGARGLRSLGRVDELFDQSNRSPRFYLGKASLVQVRNLGYKRIFPNSSTHPNSPTFVQLPFPVVQVQRCSHVALEDE